MCEALNIRMVGTLFLFHSFPGWLQRRLLLANDHSDLCGLQHTRTSRGTDYART